MHNPTLMLIATVAVGAVALTACNVSGPAAPNALLEDWDTPFGAPPFDRIQEDHFSHEGRQQGCGLPSSTKSGG